MLNEVGDYSKLYGLYIHNLTKYDHQTLAVETMERFMTEVPPLKYQYGDVVVLQPDDPTSIIIGEVMEKSGYIVQMIAPNQLYRLRDKIILHYVFTDKVINQDQSEKHVYEWENMIGLTPADLRNTRYIKTFYVK